MDGPEQGMEDPTMQKRLILLALFAAVAMPSMTPAFAADGPESCGDGKVWDADAKKCVPKPKNKGSHAG